MTSKKQSCLYFLFFLGILIFVFRSLIFNVSTNLYSWLDLPYVTWVIYQGVNKISTFSFNNFGFTNAFFPVTDSYYFSDLLLPQALLAYPFTLFIDNPILVTNIVFFITLILNYMFVFLFWKIYFKNNLTSFVTSVVFVFSPFFQLQQGHLQMISYWPFFASLFFFLKNKEFNLRSLLLSGLFLVIQFLASVYLSVFLLFSLVLYSFIRFIKDRNYDEIKKLFIVFLTFILGAGYFIYGYLQVKKHYNFVRNYGEYVTYSAHVTDYVFTTGIDSLFNKTYVAQRWNSFNKHVLGERASFPGITVFFIFVISIIFVSQKRGKIIFGLSMKYEDIFFLFLILFGFVFSLGPRLSFNGVYSEIPTPYTFLVKYVPFFDSVRGLARWSFLFYIGLIYFLGKYLLNKKIWLVSLIFALCLVECIPVNYKTTNEEYIDKNTDKILRNLCLVGNNNILLEVPTSHMSVGKGVYIGLNYISKRQLATIYHGCRLVNGYSGFEPPSQAEYYGIVENSLDNNDGGKFISKLKERGVNFVRLSPDLFPKDKKVNYLKTINELLRDKKLTRLSEFLYKVEY